MYNRKSMDSSYEVKDASELFDWSERYNKQQSIRQHCCRVGNTIVVVRYLYTFIKIALEL